MRISRNIKPVVFLHIAGLFNNNMATIISVTLDFRHASVKHSDNLGYIYVSISYV